MKKLDKHTKFFITAVIIIPLAMFTMWFLTSSCIKNAEHKISQSLDDALLKTTEERIALVEKEWEHYSGLLVMFFNHEEINRAELEILQFCTSLRQKDYPLAERNAEQIKCLLKMMRSHDEVSLRNLLAV